jgi:hypothetical protein
MGIIPRKGTTKFVLLACHWARADELRGKAVCPSSACLASLEAPNPAPPMPRDVINAPWKGAVKASKAEKPSTSTMERPLTGPGDAGTGPGPSAGDAGPGRRLLLLAVGPSPRDEHVVILEFKILKTGVWMLVSSLPLDSLDHPSSHRTCPDTLSLSWHLYPCIHQHKFPA